LYEKYIGGQRYFVKKRRDLVSHETSEDHGRCVTSRPDITDLNNKINK